MQFHGEQLRMTIVRDLRDRHEAQARIHHLAHHDVLTGLPNRMAFIERAQTLLAKADAAGQTLDGGKSAYTLHFAAGELPPVSAFWSVTVYDATTQLLVANPIDRYLINSPMLPDLTRDADGGLTVYLQQDRPSADQEANWLPVPVGPFYAMLRMYWPQEAALSGAWQAPAMNPAG